MAISIGSEPPPLFLTATAEAMHQSCLLKAAFLGLVFATQIAHMNWLNCSVTELCRGVALVWHSSALCAMLQGRVCTNNYYCWLDCRVSFCCLHCLLGKHEPGMFEHLVAAVLPVVLRHQRLAGAVWRATPFCVACQAACTIGSAGSVAPFVCVYERAEFTRCALPIASWDFLGQPWCDRVCC